MKPGRAPARRSGIGTAWRAVLGAIVLSVALVAPLPAQSPDSLLSIPKPTGYVVDRADVIDATTESQLEAYLDQLETKTGVEFAVLTVPTTAPEDPLQFKTKVYQQWGGHREGLLMLVAIEERTIAFETGYEVEGTLPDGLQSRIIRDEMVPKFRAGDPAGGIVAGVITCAERIAKEKGVTLEWGGQPVRSRERVRPRMPLWLVILIFILIVILANRSGGGGSGGRRRRGGGWWIGPGMGGGLGGWGGGGEDLAGLGSGRQLGLLSLSGGSRRGPSATMGAAETPVLSRVAPMRGGPSSAASPRSFGRTPRPRRAPPRRGSRRRTAGCSTPIDRCRP